MIRSLLAALILSVSFVIWPPGTAQAGEWRVGDTARIGGGCHALPPAQEIMAEWELNGEEVAAARWMEYAAVGMCGGFPVRVVATLVRPHDRYRVLSEGQLDAVTVWEAVLNGMPIFFALDIGTGPHDKPLMI
ncbi:hypothetical protein LCGC14_3043140 [marine sediment metagenome]|uniref:Uncharacterized protein n=1 Tax=marine sediment metagenome TaxID=412755 RepID=A0A0F8XC85_9ZZZZ